MLTRDKGIVVMLVVVSFIATGALTLAPDITYTTVTKVQFGGAMGRAMNFVARLGGGATDVTDTVYLKGNKLLQGNEEQASLIDLDGERIVMLNHKEKSYSVMSFADFRAKMEEMSGQVRDASVEPENDRGDEPTTEVTFDFKIDPTGEKSTINDHRAERFLMTILMEATSTDQPTKGEEQGTLAIASELWMSEDVKGYDEIQDFHRRFAERFGETALTETQNLADVFQEAFASDPRIKEGLEKAQAEAAKMKGVDVKNVTHVVLVGPGETFNPDLVFKGAAKEEKKPKRGRLGGLAKKLAQQAVGADDAADESSAEAPTQQTILTTTTDMEEFSTASVPASVFEIPSGYREVTFEMP